MSDFGKPDGRARSQARAAWEGPPPASNSLHALTSCKPGRWQGAAVALLRLASRAIRHVRASLTEEGEYSTSFLFLPVLAGTGAAIYFLAPTEPAWKPLLLAGALICMAIGFTRKTPSVRVLSLTFLAILGGLILAKAHTHRLATPMLGVTVNTTLIGEVVRVEATRSGRTRLTLDVLRTRRPYLHFAPRRVRLTVGRMSAGLVPGEVVEGRVRLFPVQGPVRPNGYDFSFHAYHDGIGAGGFFLGKARRILVPQQGGVIRTARTAIERLRLALTERIRAQMPGREGELAAALITGMQSGVDDEANEVLRQAGLAHILSISGLHMALVAGIVISSIRLGLALLPNFASRYPVRKFAAAVALAVLFFYLFLSGAAVATLRSALMLAVMLVAILADRPSITMRNLAIAALAILILYPHEILDPGFQMSFAATAALIAAYRGWVQWQVERQEDSSAQLVTGIWRIARTLALAVAALAMTSLVAGLASGVFGVWHFHRAAPLGIFANLAAMPVVSFAIMPLAVLSVLLIPLQLDRPAFMLLGQSIDFMLEIAAWFAARTPFDAVGAMPSAALILSAFGIVLLTLPATRLRLLGLPLLAAATILILQRSPANIIVSEDAELIAVKSGTLLAVNRGASSAFTLRVWQDAHAAEGLLLPETGEAGNSPAFRCLHDLCILTTQDGQVVAHAASPSAAQQGCAVADIMIIADGSVPPDICDRSAADIAAGREAPELILTASDLARHGAAEIYLPSRSSKPLTTLRHAVSLPWRPWHRHRAWWHAASMREIATPLARLSAQSDASGHPADESVEPNPGRAQ